MNIRDIIGDRKYIDKPFWWLFIMLISVAILALFSAGSTLAYRESSSILGPILSQACFIAIGVGLAYVIQLLPSRFMIKGGYLALAFSLLCLYIMLVPGNPFVVTINGAGRWFKLPGMPTFQPSELAKFGLVIVIADLLTKIHSEEEEKKIFWISFGLMLFTCFPILTSNFSTAALLGIIVLGMFILAKVKWRRIGIGYGTIVIALLLAYSIVELGYIRQGKTIEHGPFKRAITQVGRIDAMIREIGQDDTEFKLTDDNYQRSLSCVAIMRGGKSFFGVLPGHSQERDYLPLAYADYIFSIIVEETGLFGSILLILLYLMILFRACYTSSKYGNRVSMLMVMGLALLLTCQALISMAVAVGIVPVTGQPLPMISKGGTSALITSLYFGVMMCVAREQNEILGRKKETESKNDYIIPTEILEQ